ncbi:MAG: sel1 repeat family protein [Candidatus Nitrotoga sp.]|nr:sel1 repeat family protein [Candidatus Nitrotoga sp.]
MYHNGQGVVSDHAEAVRWWRLAAAQGNVNAQSGLGVMYGNGKGVTRDYVRAHMWFDLGAASGSTDSANNRDLIAKRMTPKQIAEAQRVAAECKNKSFKGCD